MIFHFTILFWTFIFALGLEVVVQNPFFPTWNWYLLSTVPLLIISLWACQRITKRSIDVLLLGLLSLASPTFLSFIDSPRQRQWFIFLCAGMYYFALLGLYRLRHSPKDKTAQAFLNTASLSALFFYYTSLFGFYLNFSFPLWGLMTLYFFGTAFTSYKTFSSIQKEEVKKKRLLLYSIILGLCMAEMAWVMSFWPFGYLTAGALALVFFFLIWDIAFDIFHQVLSLRKMVWRTLFFFGLIGILLWSTPWRILV
ncbi:MAG: hypothetical protein GW815_02225 [Candidatus Moranbacteria bacterium]|nr:hypothetical protein [Candidatus Moranbacteria bacterium]OIQ03512.1 MAG: hypothetical protein AUK58_01855 [Candidatus Moranbacteria bacterium CG2_30_41_165]PIP25287.1 MAG: hypothetical protein COX32_04340 [Candidatus Moranbacteria bacterium CG23_combo_of_CG06-09_8_20_14_all_41_28]PIV86571.1 MAG: hypothetical protein COW50_00630 [Candidatus Moranbacteria bacterium CG17_big_fil_post_rev_8_21_14_2_50_41_107]PIW94176.1 MAG: hypothetical protein COZ86_02440 [Candidatus Moranbacteria bacterium CG_